MMAKKKKKKNHKGKQSVYLPEPILNEIRSESARQERSMSWLIQKSWELSRKKLMSLQDIEVLTK